MKNGESIWNFAEDYVAQTTTLDWIYKKSNQHKQKHKKKSGEISIECNGKRSAAL